MMPDAFIVISFLCTFSYFHWFRSGVMFCLQGYEFSTNFPWRYVTLIPPVHPIALLNGSGSSANCFCHFFSNAEYWKKMLANLLYMWFPFGNCYSLWICHWAYGPLSMMFFSPHYLLALLLSTSHYPGVHPIALLNGSGSSANCSCHFMLKKMLANLLYMWFPFGNCYSLWISHWPYGPLSMMFFSPRYLLVLLLSTSHYPWCIHFYPSLSPSFQGHWSDNRQGKLS
jgi:hypothetical protein